ncbi:hypothetical protein NDU88_001911 [Pleurodeles waltl]|uniref:Uncharacterized protein n=1 Tax=Pleurodeles waltl TaxID=8319 RepID=A0AAV7UU68_PLEWA|nr:hypothetical protein NDU88_001911 [Pleurodeles waltl]
MVMPCEVSAMTRDWLVGCSWDVGGKVRVRRRASEKSSCLASLHECLFDGLPPGITGLCAQKDFKRGGNFSCYAMRPMG